MNVISIAHNFDDIFEDGNFPAEFLQKYDQMECLASHNGRDTILVRRKSDGVKAIATCYDCSVYPLSSNLKLLGEFDHPGLPRYYEQFENDRMVCVVREYIEGLTLSQYVLSRQMSAKEIVEKLVQLCDVLEILHSHEPQVVHRDIKPENIIVRSNGSIVLIDFDIARTVKEGEETDTVFFGTRLYAPPEQYGFGQTDSRADIYSFGVLLRWMMTGNAKKNPNITADPAIEEIIDRCTAFSPNQRYGDITDVRHALEKIKFEKRKINLKSVLTHMCVGVVMLFIGIILGNVIKTELIAEKITFEEPLIEEAVRAAIGKAEGGLTQEDLANVTELYIYGDRVFGNPESFFECHIENSTRGTVRSLEDIKKLPGLKEMRIVNQGYVDAAGIASHGMLEVVELKHMQVSNAAAIASIPNLRMAELFDSGVTDVTAFQKCPWLEALNVGYNDINSLEQIGRCSNLKSLWLMFLKLDNVDDIAERFPNLETVGIDQAQIADMSGLKKLERLGKINVSEDQYDEVTDLFKGRKIEIEIVS